jgi:transposase-like protein
MAQRKVPHIADEVLDQLLAGTDAAAALWEGGLLDGLKKALAERALNAEMDHHLGGQAGVGNSRNGYGPKTMTTDTGGWIALEVPRGRRGSFDPQLIAKYQRRFPGFDEKIVSMYARGAAANGKATQMRDPVHRGKGRECYSGFAA